LGGKSLEFYLKTTQSHFSLFRKSLFKFGSLF